MKAVNQSRLGFSGKVKVDDSAFIFKHRYKEAFIEELKHFRDDLETKTPAESMFTLNSIKPETIEKSREFGIWPNNCTGIKIQDYYVISMTNEATKKKYKYPVLIAAKSKFGNDTNAAKDLCSISFEQITPIRNKDINVQLKEFSNTIIKDAKTRVHTAKVQNTGMQIFYKKLLMALRSLF